MRINCARAIAMAAAGLLLAGSAAGANATPPSPPAKYGPGPDAKLGGPQTGLRDKRYCEVLPITRNLVTFTATIYNTIGFNDCPAAQWNAITEEKVNRAYNSVSATLNGPRHWVLDAIEAKAGSDSASSKTWYFGGIRFGMRGTVEQNLIQARELSKPYVIKNVTRHTTWKYAAGTKVFELTAPDGKVYTMQSYAQIVAKNLTYADLDGLATRLKLPAGWRYSVRTLKAPLNNVADGTAYVVQDDLKNSYMRRPS